MKACGTGAALESPGEINRRSLLKDVLEPSDVVGEDAERTSEAGSVERIRGRSDVAKADYVVAVEERAEASELSLVKESTRPKAGSGVTFVLIGEHVLAMDQRSERSLVMESTLPKGIDFVRIGDHVVIIDEPSEPMENPLPKAENGDGLTFERDETSERVGGLAWRGGSLSAVGGDKRDESVEARGPSGRGRGGGPVLGGALASSGGEGALVRAPNAAGGHRAAGGGGSAVVEVCHHDVPTRSCGGHVPTPTRHTGFGGGRGH
jgi:hypothetical protein